MDEPSTPSFIELELQERNKQAREYYHSNRSKILQTKKIKEVKAKSEICEKEGIPDYLAQYITFRRDGKIQLNFDDKEDLCKVLQHLKFKATYTSDIYVPTKK